MSIQKTDHGCRFVEFTDLYGKPCSLQESSLATEPAIWLGVDSGGGHNGRMHLSRAQVQDLIPLLQHFVKTGELPATDESPEEETSANPPSEDATDDGLLAWRESAGGEIEYVYPTEWCWRYVVNQGYPYRFLWAELRDALVDYPYKEWPSQAPRELAKLISRPGSPPRWVEQGG